MAMIFWPSLLMTFGAGFYIWDQSLSFATQSFEFIYLYACLLLFGRWLTIYLINFISVHLMTAIFNLATTAVALCEYRDSKEDAD